MTSDILQWSNLAISMITFIASLVLLLITTRWWRSLRNTMTTLRPMIFGMCLVESGIFMWSGLQVVQILYLGSDLPLITIPARILIMIGVLTKGYVATRIRTSPYAEAISSVFEKPRL
jgi:hypothetical protein